MRHKTFELSDLEVQSFRHGRESRFCSFGLLSIGLPALIASGLSGLGVGATTAGLLGTGLATGLTGAALGTGFAGITGGDLGQGALMGGLGGGLGGLGGALAPSLGIGAGIGSALGGAAGGAVGAGISGTDPFMGALTGAGAGFGASSLNAPGGFLGGPVGGGAASGAGGAGAQSLSASGGSLPSGSLTTADLTGNLGSVGQSTSASMGSNIAGGLPVSESVTVSAPAFGGGGGNLAAGVGGAAAGFGAGMSLTPRNISEQIGPLDTSSSDFNTPQIPESPGIGQQVLDTIGGGRPEGGDWFDRNGGMLLQGAGMAYSGMKQRKEMDALLKPLQDSAGQLNQQSQALSGALFGGQLPAGAKAAVDHATTTAKARTRSQYAQLGLAGSTMEADAINQIDRQAQSQTVEFAKSLMDQGMKGTAMANQLYSGILSTTLAQDKELSDAIAGFAAQMMGSQLPTAGKTITLNLGGV